MIFVKWFTLLALSLSAVFSGGQNFTLKPIRLSNNWVVTGTLTTDGTVGVIGAANIIDWNLKAVQTTDITWSEKDSTDANISGVSSDGKKIYVATSPDGVQDGGALVFSRGGPGGNIPTAAVIADFTQLSVNLGYIGGIAGWQDELWGLNYVGLNLRDNILHRAATLDTGQVNVFRVQVPILSTTPLFMKLSGTITTDGTVGPLLPQNIVAWNLTARNQEIHFYTKANSTILAAAQVSSDGTVIDVAHAGGQLVIGVGGMRPTFITIADFTDPSYPNGFANYYTGAFGVMGEKWPLAGKRVVQYAAAAR